MVAHFSVLNSQVFWTSEIVVLDFFVCDPVSYPFGVPQAGDKSDSTKRESGWFGTLFSGFLGYGAQSE